MLRVLILYWLFGALCRHFVFQTPSMIVLVSSAQSELSLPSHRPIYCYRLRTERPHFLRLVVNRRVKLRDTVLVVVEVVGAGRELVLH